MGFFRNNTKRLIQQFKAKSEYYFNDLGKEIKEQLDDLKSDYEENSSVIPEYMEFVNILKVKLDNQDAQKLEEFSSRLAKVNRNAKNGIEALALISSNQRKITAENRREYDEFE